MNVYDLIAFVACMTGPLEQPEPPVGAGVNCSYKYNFDCDAAEVVCDLDLRDFSVLQNEWTGVE